MGSALFSIRVSATDQPRLPAGIRSRTKKRRRTLMGMRRRGLWDPAMTDFRARGTIMGLAGLTAVFGMGTGGAPPVSSPESARRAVKPPGPTEQVRGRDTLNVVVHSRGGIPSIVKAAATFNQLTRRGPCGCVGSSCRRRSKDRGRAEARQDGSSRRRPGRVPGWGTATGRGGQAVRLLGPVGCDGRPSCTPGLSTW
jgi:hypothetical protein